MSVLSLCLSQEFPSIISRHESIWQGLMLITLRDDVASSKGKGESNYVILGLGLHTCA